MPINKKLMKSLEDQYGKETAKDVYWGMVQKGKVKGEKIRVKKIRVKSYTRKNHGKSHHGGKVRSHTKSGRAYVDISYGDRGREYVKKLRETGTEVDVFPMKGHSESRRMRIKSLPFGRDIERRKKLRALAEEYKDVRY